LITVKVTRKEGEILRSEHTVRLHKESVRGGKRNETHKIDQEIPYDVGLLAYLGSSSVQQLSLFPIFKSVDYSPQTIRTTQDNVRAAYYAVLQC
jgi:hypothetical protein